MKTPEQIRGEVRAKRLAPDKKTPFRYRWLWALMTSDLSPMAKLQGVAVWLHADEHGEGAHPGQATIAALTGVGQRAARNHTRELEGARFLSTVAGAGKRTTSYAIDIPQQLLAELDEGLRAEPTCRTGRNAGAGLGGTRVPPIYSGNQRSESTQYRVPVQRAPVEDFALDIRQLDDRGVFDASLFEVAGQTDLGRLSQHWGWPTIEMACTWLLKHGRPGEIRSWADIELRMEATQCASVA